MTDMIAQVMALAWSAWRRRAYALAVAWSVCLTGWGVVVLLPDVYGSSAVIHVNTDNILEPLLGGLTVSSDVEKEVALMARTLLSRPNLEKLVRTTELNLRVKDAAEMERLVADLANRTTVQRDRANVFTISFTDRDPRVAQDVVQGLLDVFVETNLGQSREDMDKARRFIENQIRVYEQQLEEAEWRLVRFKQDNRALLGRAVLEAHPGDSWEALERALGRAGQTGYQVELEVIKEAELEQTKTELREAKLRRDTLRRELEHIPQFLPANAQGSGPPLEAEIQLLETQTTLDDLRSRYTEKHPDVVIARRRLEALQELYEQELESAERFAAMTTELDGSDDGGFPNPVYEQMKLELVEEEARIAKLTDKVVQVRASLEKAAALAERAPKVQAELAKLTRDYNVLRSKYQSLVSSREAERISRAREFQAEGVEFRIVETPEIPSLPSGPNRILFMLMALVVGMGAGVGFAVLLASASESFTSVGELKTALVLPVLGTVSISDCARTHLWLSAKALVFWVCLGALLTVCAGLVLLEVRIGFGQILTDEFLSTIPVEWLRRLPVS